MQVTSKTLSPAIDRLKELGLDEITVKKEVSFALQAVNKSPHLLECDPKSIAEAVVNIANTGLSLNPVLAEAYLVPRFDKRTRTKYAVLEPSYKGLAKLAMEAGAVKRINAQLVYEQDIFEIDLADDQKPVTHKPYLKDDRGELLGVYCLSTLPDGSKQVEWMERQEVYQIREASESYKAFQAGRIKSCVWIDHEGEMFRKTVVRRAQKYLPKVDSTKYEQFQNAIALDQLDYKATVNQYYRIESLLRSANITPEQADQIEDLLKTELTSIEASNWISYLKENQLPDTPQMGGAKQVTKAAAAASEAVQKERT